MFSRKNNLKFSPLFLQQAAICLFFFFLLLPASTLSLRFTMQQFDNKLCEDILSLFLNTYHQQGLLALQKQFSATATDKTTFLRLQTQKNQLLLLSDIHGGQTVTLPNLTTVDTNLAGTWIRLNNQVPEYWTIRLATLPGGNILQVGIRTTESVLLYKNVKRKLLITWMLLSPVSILAAGLTFLSQRRALTKLGEKIEKTVHAGSGSYPGERPLPPGEQGLLLAVDHLINRHRSLNRQLQETMDNVAHDLRTPLTRLRTIAEYGLQEKGDPDQLRERLTDCLEESDRILSMLNTMLNVAEAESQSMVLNLQPIDLRGALEQVIELYTIVAEEKNCTLSIQDSEPVMALVDPNRIGQVWANLIDNAIKYGATKITISLEQKNGWAIVTIHDNGMGISESERDQIWGRLFRGDRSRSQPGLGLGLTLVRAIINAHAGSITVNSTLNTETTFTVKLPQPPSS